MSAISKKVNIIRVRDNIGEEIDDQVAKEKPFTLYINNEEFVTLLCSGENLEYLMIGFLYSEGFIKTMEDIKSIRIEDTLGYGYIDISEQVFSKMKIHGKRTLTSGCGKGTVFYDVLDSLTAKPVKDQFHVEANHVLDLSNRFNKNSVLFKETGGVHACALCDEKKILLFHEDIGRHNALDKIIGHAMKDNISLQGKWLLTSGRISSEMLIKTAKQGIAMIVSRSAPTDLSVELAERMNITLVGFARGNRMNVYANSDRVTYSK
ncbi:FdhD protein [Tindallia magadiensis]|uniref:Sulfur carrier protein FdhD n=1 Tax=Tindallia magadiensis TaxID=69895 RepID=A0A1I3F673_9FIRM|nr:formate dehydrogenase accessory sulfurtransferase FdhD [Tindallia magadiensis]SFI06704.1 FdhD protein [Tindallia magadiensis]